jgi:hypothetical protein
MIIKVGFLTARKFSLKELHWYILGKLIELIQGKYVHTFVIYIDSCWGSTVREMSGLGVKKTDWSTYFKKYYNRLEIVDIETDSIFSYRDFTDFCKNSKAKYEYKNLIIWQLVHKVTGKWFGKDTSYRRICSEDSARAINKAVIGLVQYPDKVSPTELYDIVTNYSYGRNKQYVHSWN